MAMVQQATELAMAMGEPIFFLTVHHLDRTCIERARWFLKQHGGRWSNLPPETGARPEHRLRL